MNFPYHDQLKHLKLEGGREGVNLDVRTVLFGVEGPFSQEAIVNILVINFGKDAYTKFEARFSNRNG